MQQRDQQIHELYAQGLSLRAVADRVGVSLDTVRYSLRRGQVQPRKRGRPPSGAAAITIRFNESELGHIDKYASRYGFTRPEAVRSMILPPVED